jgi:hypothetical protein
MTTSASTADPLPVDRGQAARLRLTEAPGLGQLDGSWWPRSSDVTVELQELLGTLPPDAGRVSRVTLPMADWPLPHPTRSVQRGLPVKVGWFRGMERHTITLGSSSARARRLLLMVVPAEADPEQAERDIDSASRTTQLRTTALLAQAVVPLEPPAPGARSAGSVTPPGTGPATDRPGR